MNPAWMLLLAISLVSTPHESGTVRGTVETRFTATSTLHDFEGAAPAIEYTAIPDEDLGWTATVSLPVTAIDTGNAVRDGNMRKMLDAERYPEITAQLTGFATDDRSPSAADPLEFDLTIRDVTRHFRAPLQNWREVGGRVSFDLSFEVSLRDFGLTPPSVLFIKVGDEVTIHVRVEGSMARAARAGATGPGQKRATTEDSLQ